MYNQLDIRNYFPQDIDSDYLSNYNLNKKAKRRYIMMKIKERLWKNPLWRGFIKFLKKTGILNLLKKAKIKSLIKKIARI